MHLFEASELLEPELERIDRVASRFRDDSELSRLNAGAGSEVVVGHDLFEAIDVALAMAAATDGLVDPTVGAAMNRLGYDRDFAEVLPGVDGELPPDAVPFPGGAPSPSTGVDAPSGSRRTALLDLGATAKALAADRAAATIHQRLGCGVLVSLGGDASAAGPAPAGGFAIGIADTCTSPAPAEAVAISSGGLASSGIGVRHVATGSAPGPSHRGPGHRSVRGALLADGLDDGRHLRAGERGVYGSDGAGGARRRLAGGPRAPGTAGAARRDGRLHHGLADPRSRRWPVPEMSTR